MLWDRLKRKNSIKEKEGDMKKAQWMALLLAALLALPGCALAGDVWTVNVSHDLEGGSWPDDRQILPYQLVAPVGKSMDPNSLHMEKMVQPFMAESVFMGWSVLFTDAYNGELVYDGRQHTWDLDHPFDYYPDNPRAMDCLMIANWRPQQTADDKPGPCALLLDGRLLCRPGVPGSPVPLPEEPPPAGQIVEGLEWLGFAIVSGLEEGQMEPVYFLPATDGSIIDWLQDNEDVEYAAYFDNDWVMLYSPKWVDGGGIGFMSWDHVSLPGVDVD